MFVAGFGIRLIVEDPRAIAPNVCLGEDRLEQPDGLLAYIEEQKGLISGHLPGVRIAGPMPTGFPAAEEAHLVLSRHAIAGVGNMVHAQTYLRQGTWVGIVTLTAHEQQIQAVRPVCDAFLKGVYIQPEAPNDLPERAPASALPQGGR